MRVFFLFDHLYIDIADLVNLNLVINFIDFRGPSLPLVTLSLLRVYENLILLFQVLQHVLVVFLLQSPLTHPVIIHSLLVMFSVLERKSIHFLDL